MNSVLVPRLRREQSLLISLWSSASLRIHSGLFWILGDLFAIALEMGVGKRGFGFPLKGTLTGCVPRSRALICKYILGRSYGENRAGTWCRVTRGDIILHQWSSTVERGGHEGQGPKGQGQGCFCGIISLHLWGMMVLVYGEQQRYGSARAD